MSGERRPAAAEPDRSEEFGERLLGRLLDLGHELPPRLIAPLIAGELDTTWR